MPNIPRTNTGVLERGPEETDYKWNVKSAIVEVVRNASGNWKKYEPPGEWQKLLGVDAPQNGFNTGGVDFLDCVSFSANDALEVLLGQQIATGKIPQTHIDWLRENGYFNPDGTLNFSDRFTAKMSGTTKDGNSLKIVGQSIHDSGLVPETMWPMPVSEIRANPSHYWETYYEEIPAAVIAKGKEFTKYFETQYEFVFYPGSPNTLSSIENCLKLAPLQIAVAFCAGWNDDVPIHGCGAGSDHAVVMTNADETGYHILDHYNPFDKRLGPDYNITYGMRHVAVALSLPSPANAVLVQQGIDVAKQAIALEPQLPANQRSQWFARIQAFLATLLGSLK